MYTSQVNFICPHSIKCKILHYTYVTKSHVTKLVKLRNRQIVD